ncbi:MAG: AAA family ATPase [Planctomycetaceae bacterium]|nr:AAA family ATPase [Planctomycetaceae bacterium]
MKVIAIISQKGGSGKTTLATNLFVASIKVGLKTVLFDLDQQSSACKWADRGQRGENEPVVDAQPGRLPMAIKKADEMGVDVAIIDTPGNIEQPAMAAAQIADIALLPFQPSIADLDTCDSTLNLLNIAGVENRFAVLTRVKPFGTRHEETAEWLQKQKQLSVCPTTIGERIAIQDAYALGLGVQEFESSGKAAKEIEKVYKYTSKLVGMS